MDKYIFSSLITERVPFTVHIAIKLVLADSLLTERLYQLIAWVGTAVVSLRRGNGR
jgi:hypothetical protein